MTCGLKGLADHLLKADLGPETEPLLEDPGIHYSEHFAGGALAELVIAPSVTLVDCR